MSPLAAAWFAAAGADGYGAARETDFAVWVLAFELGDVIDTAAIAQFDPFSFDRDFCAG
jgi:hypothetical protein